LEERKRPSCFNAIYGSSKKKHVTKESSTFLRGEKNYYFIRPQTHTPHTPHTHTTYTHHIQEITKLKKGLKEGKSIVIALISSWKRMRGGYFSSGKET